MSIDMPALRSAAMPVAQAAAQSAKADLAATAAPAAAHPAAAAGSAALQPIHKAEVRFDPDQLRRDLEDVVQRMNDQVQTWGRNLAFSVDKVADRQVITVRHSVTGEVVRQIPDEAALRMAHSIEQLRGLLTDKRT